jgi:hypothetical protein
MMSPQHWQNQQLMHAHREQHASWATTTTFLIGEVQVNLCITQKEHGSFLGIQWTTPSGVEDANSGLKAVNLNGRHETIEAAPACFDLLFQYHRGSAGDNRSDCCRIFKTPGNKYM